MRRFNMTYTIKELSAMVDLSAYTIRYYEKIDLLPKAERNESKYRVYTKKDVERLRLILCMKKTGMSLEEIKPYLDLDIEGDITDYPELIERAISHKEKVLKQIEDLQQVVYFIDQKLKQKSFHRRDCAE